MNYFLIGLILISAGCSSSQIDKLLDPKGPAAVIAVDLAQDVLKQEQPAVNAAIAELPDEVQALAQMAYGALQTFVDRLDAMQPKSLAVHDPSTVSDTTELKGVAEDVKAQLDTLIH